jgi:hypothetical protein
MNSEEKVIAMLETVIKGQQAMKEDLLTVQAIVNAMPLFRKNRLGHSYLHRVDRPDARNIRKSG